MRAWLTLERLIALVILIIALFYVYGANHIRMLPFELRQPFKANTYPLYLGYVTIVVAGLLVLLPPRPGANLSKDAAGWRDFDWKRYSSFIGLMILYALFLRPLGFLASTVLFLLAGTLVLKEYRLWFSLPIILIATIGLWYLVTQTLGIYMPPAPNIPMLENMLGLDLSWLADLLGLTTQTKGR